MTSSEGIMKKHLSGDQALTILTTTSGLIGEFVSSFPGKDNNDISPRWLENWFTQRTQSYYSSTPDSKINKEELIQKLATGVDEQSILLSSKVKIISILPHYFRGFRNPDAPINLSGDLIVIDGRNSSGKTSLAEAFEWLLTGQLLRRSIQQYGDARELECCIANQFKPDDEDTWVEAEFVTEDNTRLLLRRVLIKDYGPTQTSVPDTVFIMNGNELTYQEEEAVLDQLFAGIPPILMQHSLRLFVHSSPSDRRDYFERLLRLDELTYLIERAVIGNARLSEFPSPTGSVAYKRWDSFKAAIQNREATTVAKRIDKIPSKALSKGLQDALVGIGLIEFADLVDERYDYEQIKLTLKAKQKSERQKSFPLLDDLRPKRTVDDLLESDFSSEKIKPILDQLQSAYSNYLTAEKAAQTVGQAQIAIAKAMVELRTAGVILDLPDPQICPLCDYQEVLTLTKERVLGIESWHPIQKAAEESKRGFVSKKDELLRLVEDFQLTRSNLIPNLPDEEEKVAALSGISSKILDTANNCLQELESCLAATYEFNQACTNIQKILSQPFLSDQDITDTKNLVATLIANAQEVLRVSRIYNTSFSELDRSVGAEAREDPGYNLRELWLSVSEEIDSLVDDILWERAKSKAQTELGHIRDALILARKKLLERRRTEFSNGMTTIWSKLRADRYSVFSKLYIPEPRGKGYPVEIEVKALLDDGTQVKEVDALRVFSESQVNVLGIAAFATRSKLLGHRMLILDDPVQSMDEEHFKTFAQELLPEFLTNDTQVIILTHNDTFAKELSFAWYEHDEYVTMQINHSRKKGCRVEEGSRRVAERLKQSEKFGEDGNMKDAWRSVRLALERLYTVVYKKYGPSDFNPLSWSDQTAEYMWDDRSGNGVGVIIESMVPGSEKRLREILSMTAAGAHDKPEKGFTDLINAIKDIRSMLPKLRIGNG